MQVETATKLSSPEELDSRATERHAFDAVIWGMPAVNYELMYQEALRNGAGPNQIVYWGRLPVSHVRASRAVWR